MVSYLGNKYIFSRKPNPAVLSVKDVNWKEARKELRDFYQKTKDCRVEVLMKDNHTLGNKPENIIEWSKIAKEEASKIYNL